MPSMPTRARVYSELQCVTPGRVVPAALSAGDYWSNCSMMLWLGGFTCSATCTYYLFKNASILGVPFHHLHQHCHLISDVPCEV